VTGNVDLLFEQVPVVVAHVRAGADACARIAVAVDERAAIPGGISWTSVAGARANLC
jgi:hypothetical protein